MSEYKNKSPEDLFNIIRDCCQELGWSIAFDESESFVSGTVIGQHSYVVNVLDQLEEKDDYSLYQLPTSEVDTELH